ncbi:very short patch repair endonuclease [Nibricoccus aquaticus]|uniref:Very short patch repair endonuclease n=1 Tax=Nibricoccus aquaticus TaxID=2576891 RepID=A0A290QAL1_9BACT|nr:very short patch repair endonuclease [Nibricoccus aquaticus]
MDRLSTKARSRLMASVRRKDTKPEMLLRRALHKLGYRYRINQRSLPGSPDLVFAKRRVVIFVHGCFWHDHSGCRFATKPKSQAAFWADKFRANKERDSRAYMALKSTGWKTLVVWECALKGASLGKTILKADRWLKRPSPAYLELSSS